MRRTIRATLAATVVLASLTACGSASTESGDTSVDMAAVEEAVDKYLAQPTDVGITEPLGVEVPAGKMIVAIASGSPVGQLQANSVGEAAEALGYDFQKIETKPAPEEFQRAFETALAVGADGIFVSGGSRDVLAKQLEEAEAKGVKVVLFGSTDDAGGAVVEILVGPDFNTQLGEAAAAYAVRETKEKTKVVVFELAGYPITESFTEGVQTAMDKFCKGCEVEVEPLQQADIGTKIPSAVVSKLQNDPTINWILFTVGPMSTGVPAALESAGLSDTVNIGGTAPTAANYEAVKTGDEKAWVAYPSVIGAWASVDALLRSIAGVDIPSEPALPRQVIDETNVDSPAFTSDGEYVGFPDYAAAFKQLWLGEQ